MDIFIKRRRQVEELFDDFSWTKENKTITQNKHHVPGLGNLTYWNFTAAPPSKPIHYHTHIMEFHCLVKGQRTTQIKAGDEYNSYTCTGNELLITFPFELHGNITKSQLPCEFYAFQLIMKNPDSLLGLNKQYSNILYHRLMNLPHRQYNLGSSHMQYLRQTFNFFSDMSEYSIAVGVQFLSSFLFSLPFLMPTEEARVLAMDEGISKSISYLRKNLGENLRLIDLAQISGYSLSRFKSKFRNETGITPAEYIALQKIEYAKHQLSETDTSITELAYSLGFSSSNYFSTVFKKYSDFTPREYRSLYTSGHSI